MTTSAESTTPLTVAAAAEGTTDAGPDGRPGLGTHPLARHALARRTTVRRQPSSATVVVIASFGAFLAFLDSTIVNIAFPDIQESFPGSPLSDLSWVLNSYNIALAALLVVAGRYADLMGRRRMFGVGILVFTLASVLCAFAPSVGALIGWRVLQGVGAALMIPASLALVVQGFDPARRAHGITLWGAAAAIASGLGPPVGGALVEVAGWRAAFLVNLPLGLLAYVASRRLLVESRSPVQRRRPDLRGATLLAVGLGLLTTGLIKGPDWTWQDPRTLAAFAGAAVAIAGFVVSSRHHRAPLLDPALLRVRSFAVGNVLGIIASTGFYAYLLTHVFYLHLVWRYDLVTAGLAVAPAAFVAAVVASVLGRFTDRHGHRLIIGLGALFWAASLVWYLTQVGVEPAFVREWLPGQVLQGIGVGATLPLVGSAALARLPKGEGYAVAAAVTQSSRQLGAVLGVALLVVIIGTPAPLELRESLERGWAFAAICFVVVAAGAVLLGRTAHEHGDVAGDEAAEEAPATAPAAVRLVTVAEAGDDDVVTSLAEVELFRSLAPDDLRQLVDASEDVDLDAGSYLFRQGDAADALYVVATGRLAVERDGALVEELARGAVVGELGLLTGGARAASVRAVRDTRLLRLSAEQFTAVADADVLRSLARGLAERIQRIQPPRVPARRSRDAVVAVLGVTPGLPVRALTDALAHRVGARLTVAAPEHVDRAGLERAEAAADRVLLGADRGDADWWAFCLRVADRVVLVADGPPPAFVDIAAAHPAARGADLLLLGTLGDAAVRRAWESALAPRSMHDLLDVRATDAAAGLAAAPGVAALADRLAGASLGLVLGGGGARGFAHVGVLEVLEEEGLRPGRVAGTSIGAAVGALAAAGLGAAQVDACLYDNFVRSNPLSDYTLPSKGLIRGRRSERLLGEVFDGLHVEDLPLEFRCVSVDLLGRRRVVHRAGPLDEVVSASMRLPGLFAPRRLDDVLHVDGGVLDNLPVSALDRADGPIVTVTIGFDGTTPAAGAGDAPRTVRTPALADTLLRTMLLASGDAAQEAMAASDLVIRPDVRGTGLLEWHQIDVMRAAGRDAARAALPQIRALLA